MSNQIKHRQMYNVMTALIELRAQSARVRRSLMTSLTENDAASYDVPELAMELRIADETLRRVPLLDYADTAEAFDALDEGVMTMMRAQIILSLMGEMDRTTASGELVHRAERHAQIEQFTKLLLLLVQ